MSAYIPYPHIFTKNEDGEISGNIVNFHPENYGDGTLHFSYDNYYGIAPNEDLGILHYPDGLVVKRIDGKEYLYDQVSGELYYALAPADYTSRGKDIVTDLPNGRIVVNAETNELHPDSWVPESADIHTVVSYRIGGKEFDVPAYVGEYYMTSYSLPSSKECRLFDTENLRVLEVVKNEEQSIIFGDAFYLVDSATGRPVATKIGEDGKGYLVDQLTGLPYQDVVKSIEDGSYTGSVALDSEIAEHWSKRVVENSDGSIVTSRGIVSDSGDFFSSFDITHHSVMSYINEFTGGGWFPSGCLVCVAGLIFTELGSRYYQKQAELALETSKPDNKWAKRRDKARFFDYFDHFMSNRIATGVMAGISGSVLIGISAVSSFCDTVNPADSTLATPFSVGANICHFSAGAALAAYCAKVIKSNLRQEEKYKHR